MVLEAIISDSILTDDKLLVVRDIVFENPLLLHPEKKDLPVFLTCNDVFSSEESNVNAMSRFSFISGGQYEANGGLKHCSGRFYSCSHDELRDRLSRKAAHIKRQTTHLAAAHVTKNIFRTKVMYNMVFNRVVTYSPKYQTIQELSVVEGGLEGFGTFRLPEESLNETGSLSPVFVDTLDLLQILTSNLARPAYASRSRTYEFFTKIYAKVRSFPSTAVCWTATRVHFLVKLLP